MNVKRWFCPVLHLHMFQKGVSRLFTANLAQQALSLASPIRGSDAIHPALVGDGRARMANGAGETNHGLRLGDVRLQSYSLEQWNEGIQCRLQPFPIRRA